GAAGVENGSSGGGTATRSRPRAPALRSAALQPELALDPVHVAGGLHVVEGLLHGHVRADDEGGADDALHHAAVVLLLAEGAVGLQGGLVRVAEQREGQALLVAEGGELLRGVRGDAEHGEPRGVEGPQVVPEVAGLRGAPGGHRRGVEVDDRAAAGGLDHLAQRHRVPVGVGEGEVGGGVARLQARAGVGHGTVFLCCPWWLGLTAPAYCRGAAGRRGGAGCRGSVRDRIGLCGFRIAAGRPRRAPPGAEPPAGAPAPPPAAGRGRPRPRRSGTRRPLLWPPAGCVDSSVTHLDRNPYPPGSAPTMAEYTLDDVRERTCRPRDSWWTVAFVDPAAVRLVRLAANRTRITPDQLTVAALFFGLGAAACFAMGTPGFLVAGALLYYLCFLLDCMDGKLARLTDRESMFGSWMDYVFDRFRVLVCAVALMGGQ